jgi:hypothetical protein
MRTNRHTFGTVSAQTRALLAGNVTAAGRGVPSLMGGVRVAAMAERGVSL